MPRYFFDVLNKNDSFQDTEGTVLKDIRSARHEALRFASTLLEDDRLRRDLGSTWFLVVRDMTSAAVMRLRIQE